MLRVLLTVLMATCVVASAFAVAGAPGRYVVTTEQLNVRLASDRTGKVTKIFYQGQKIKVLEVSNGWARISEYYDGANDGIAGSVAQWVRATHLAALPPPKAKIKVDVNSPVFQAIKSSDDLDVHQGVFVTVSAKLVESGQCKLSDFRDIGGWWRSAAHNPRSVYYTYCGGASNDDRIYVDTATGRTFR
jgi:hypothetical protein